MRNDLEITFSVIEGGLFRVRHLCPTIAHDLRYQMMTFDGLVVFNGQMDGVSR